MSEISQYDNQIRSERSRLGKINNVKNNLWYGSTPPFGYDIKNKKLVINEEQTKWVNYIYKQYSLGMSLHKIVKELLKNGVETNRGNKVFSTGSLNKILQNTHYRGYWYYKDKKSGQTYKGTCEQIVPIELLNKCDELRKSRSYKKGSGRTNDGGNPKHEYLLKGLLKCGNCGSNFGGKIYTKQYLRHYYCLRNERNWKNLYTDRYVECKRGKRTLDLDLTDQLIWEGVIGVIEKSFLFKEEKKNLILSKKNLKQDKVLIKKLELQKVRSERELKKLEDILIDLESQKLMKTRPEREIKKIIENVETERNRNQEKVQTLNRQIEGSLEDTRWVDWVKEFSDKMKNLRKEETWKDIQEKKRFLFGLVDTINVNYTDVQTHKLEIFFKIPYVNDKLIYNDGKSIKSGYKIRKGKKSVILDFSKYKDNLKKKREIQSNTNVLPEVQSITVE